MHKNYKFLSSKWLAFFLLTIFSFYYPFHTNADTNDVYEIEPSNSRSGYLDAEIEYYVRCSYINYCYKFDDTTKITYNSDGTVRWRWEDGIGVANIMVKGIQIDNSGSFMVKSGSYIGGYEHYSQGGDWYLLYHYNLYPMMQYNGMDILLTDWDNIIFRVGPDKIIRMECNKDNIPSHANVGFGTIETNYISIDYNNYSGDQNPYYSNSETSKAEFGPSWVMFLDFKLIPISMDPDSSIDRIVDDNTETELPVYDIMGNRVDRNNLSPGIYICRGKKILVK